MHGRSCRRSPTLTRTFFAIVFVLSKIISCFCTCFFDSHKEEILKAARENDGLLTPKMVALLHGNEIVRRQTPAEADELYDGENGDANVNGDINRPPFSRLVDKLNKGSR